ncbi:MAG: hypothetical protein R2811_00345 [Flavobacteriales bacterium]
MRLLWTYAPITITTLFYGCSQSIGNRAWYYAYLNHAEEYNMVTHSVMSELERMQANGDSIDFGCASLIDQIESIEQELLRRAGQVDVRLDRTDDPPAMNMLMDYEISTAMLIGEEPAKPDTGQYTAYNLKMRMMDAVHSLSACCNGNPDLFQAILNTEDVRQGQYGIMTSWEAANFYHLPLVSVLDKLNDIKMKVRYAELQALACRSAKQVSDSMSATHLER